VGNIDEVYNPPKNNQKSAKIIRKIDEKFYSDRFQDRQDEFILSILPILFYNQQNLSEERLLKLRSSC